MNGGGRRSSLDAPATRLELIEMIEAIHDALIAQARFTAAFIDKGEREQRELGDRAIEASVKLLAIAERMLGSESAKH